MHPLHRLGGRERQGAREHLKECNAERIEVSSGIDRTVHAPSLLGRHVGERAGDRLRRLGRLAFARQARGDAKACQLHLSRRRVHQDVAGFDVLVHDATLVEPAQSRRHADGQAQEPSHLHGWTEQPMKRLAAAIFEDQDGSLAIGLERQRPHRPRTIQHVFQAEFVDKAIECLRLGGQNGQNRAAATVIPWLPPAAEDAFSVFP